MKYHGKETSIKIYYPDAEKPVFEYRAENVVVSDNGIEYDQGGLDRMAGKAHVIIRGIPFMVVERELEYEEIPGEDC